MIEVIQIFLHFALFVFFTYFPINKFTAPKISQTFENSNFNFLFINTLILLFLFLIFSFFRINLYFVFAFIFFIYFLLFILNFSNIIKELVSTKKLHLKILFFIICLGFFFNTAYNLEIGWDGLSIWIFKANNFYNGRNYADLFFDKVPYIQYPHLGSYIWAFFWKNSIIEKEYLGRIFYAYVYVVSLFVLINSIKNLTISKKFFFILFIIIFSFDYNNSMGGYQEYLIFSLLIFAVKIIEIFKSTKKKINDNYLYLALMSNLILLSWIKNESMFYSFFLLIIFIIEKKFNKKSLIFGILTFFIILLQIFSKKYFFELEKAFLFSLSFESIFKNFNISEFINRIYFTTFYIFHSALKYPISIINILSIILVIKYFKKLRSSFYLLLFFLMNLAFLYAVYMVTDAPLIWHLKTSIERLILQTSGLYIFLLIHLLNKKIIKI
jgi:hypothetical protein